MRKTLLAVLLSAALMPAQTEGPVVGVGPFLHMVSDLDQSLAFYRDKLGLELTGPAGEHKFTDNPAVANLYGVPGKQFRAAVLKIPGSEMRVELAEWRDSAPLSGDGYASLMIYRADGSPYRPEAFRGRKLLHDPDGFPVALGRTEELIVDLLVTADDIPKTTTLYTKVLGFKADGKRLLLPGTSLGIHLGDTRASDIYTQPSRAMLRLQVRDIDGLTASMKSAGFSVITTGGVPVTLPQGQRVIILRDPNNFYWQLMETR
jgi:catechol 2,3-dioxygenase-like lactoylglutathione lyase family enzyme